MKSLIYGKNKHPLIHYIKNFPMSFSFRPKHGITRLASVVAIASILPLPALSIPVSTSSEFITYLNSDQSWGNGYKFKFNWVSDCSKNMTPMPGLMPLFAPMVLSSAYLRKEKEAVAV